MDVIKDSVMYIGQITITMRKSREENLSKISKLSYDHTLLLHYP